MANDALIAKWRRVAKERPDMRARADEVLAQLGATSEPEAPAAAPKQPASVLEAQQQRQEGPSFLSRVGDTAISAAKGLGNAAMEAPAAFKADPLGAGRAALAGLPGGVSFGALGPEQHFERMEQAWREAERLGQMSERARARGQAEYISSDGLRQAREDYQTAKANLEATQKHKLARIGGELASSGFGAGGVIQRNVTKAVPAAGAVARVARTGAGSAVGGAVEGAGRTLAAGGNAVDAGDAAAQAATLGGLFSIMASGGSELIRKGSPWIGRRAAAADAGLLDDAKALPKGRRGITRASERARDDILDRDDAIAGQESAVYQQAEQAVSGRPAPLEPVTDRLAEVQAKTRYSGGDVRAGAARTSDAIDSAFDDITRQERTVGDVLQARRDAGQNAGFGAPNPTPEQIGQRGVYGAFNQALHDDAVAPGLGAADARYTAHKQTQSRRNDILLRSEDGGRPVDLPPKMSPEQASVTDVHPARASMRVGDEVKAASTLERLGDDSVEALRAEPYLAELAAQDPAFAAALERLMAKKALEATRLFTMEPGTRTNLGNAVGSVPILGEALGGTVHLASQYGRAGGRIADQILGGTAQPGARLVPPLMNPLDALRQRQAQEKRR